MMIRNKNDQINQSFLLVVLSSSNKSIFGAICFEILFLCIFDGKKESIMEFCLRTRTFAVVRSRDVVPIVVEKWNSNKIVIHISLNAIETLNSEAFKR